MTRTLKVVPYDSGWADQFQVEKNSLQQVFGDILVAVHHIGSTSIPGIKAKPIIDILVVVRNIEQVDACNDAMIVLGYEPRGEFGIPGRRFFSKGGEEHRSHHVHVFESGHPEIARHLDFCDYLRAHPEEARRYGQLKEELARKFRHASDRYTEGKTEMIREMDRKALAWREAKRSAGENG